MSLSYRPSSGARPDKYWGPKYLVSISVDCMCAADARQSNRDITGQAPIDKTAFPGVQVTAACHHDGVYDSDLFETCFSNLIAVGFRRMVIDLYWDVTDRTFNLCPVHVPDFDNSTTEAAAEEVQRTDAGKLPPRALDISNHGLENRQDQTANGTTTSNRTASTPTSTSTTASASPNITTSIGESGSQLIHLGPFRCGSDLHLGSIIGIIDDFLDGSSDAPAATLQMFEFNLHSAKSAADPYGPPQRVFPAQLPSILELVGVRINRRMGSQLYDPRDLAADRANLNASWFQVRVSERLPMTGYFNTYTLSNGAIATHDGWPSELYLLLTRLERVMLSWGTIDEEMEGYNFDVDSQHVFARGLLSETHDLSLNQAGVVTSGCFYRDVEKAVDQVNNTWAITNINLSQDAGQDHIQNMTSCGVSPMLNTTFGNQSAGMAYLPYQVFTQATNIGWADGEPKNASSPHADVDGDDDQFRCVVIDSSNDYRGKWRVVSCQGQYRAACRIGGQPYNWRLTRTETDFTGAPEACPDGSSFDLPVSQLENTYLYEHILADAANASDSSIQRSVWINLNALDEMDCWVTTGPNGTCRYQQNSNETHNRQVLVPAIGALIILLLTVLTILVKCNVNRRNNRRHRVGPGGWEYEGVPS